jgi:hypothetical protein
VSTVLHTPFGSLIGSEKVDEGGAGMVFIVPRVADQEAAFCLVRNVLGLSEETPTTGYSTTELVRFGGSESAAEVSTEVALYTIDGQDARISWLNALFTRGIIGVAELAERLGHIFADES